MLFLNQPTGTNQDYKGKKYLLPSKELEYFLYIIPNINIQDPYTGQYVGNFRASKKNSIKIVCSENGYKIIEVEDEIKN